jgi:hypothetical protein
MESEFSRGDLEMRINFDSVVESIVGGSRPLLVLSCYTPKEWNHLEAIISAPLGHGDNHTNFDQ